MNPLTLQIQDHAAALAFLFGRINYERKERIPYRSRGFKLDRMRRLLTRIGNPEQDLAAVHVAGTKGKGSTSAMIAAALQAAGYRVGLYTSPHLECLEERFVVNQQMCSGTQLVDLLARIAPVVADMDRQAASDGRTGPTYFEITTAVAFLHFRDMDVDCAVLEVGLGGRLDSTNVCHPAVSVITSISLDHTRQLGKTLAAIAGEKAGIIKPQVPVVTGVQARAPLDVIRATARQHNARLLALGHDFHFTYQNRALALPMFGPCLLRSGELPCLDYREDVDGVARRMDAVRIRLRGAHQAANAAVALATLSQLRRAGWRVSERAARIGLEQAFCPARVEIVQQQPTVVLDAAHNVASVRALLEVVAGDLPARRRILVFATSRDKDPPAMLDELLPYFEQVVLTRYVTNPRAASPSQLADVAEQIKKRHGLHDVVVHTRDTPDAAWQLARASAHDADVVCITGSFFLAAELRKHFVRPVVASAERP